MESARAKMPGLRSSLESATFGPEGQYKLAQFEIASLINLVPEDSEEAIVLIPSLSERLEPDEIENLLLVVKGNIGGAVE